MNVRNPTNNTYAYVSTACSASLGLFTRSYDEPRMYGIEVGFHF